MSKPRQLLFAAWMSLALIMPNASWAAGTTSKGVESAKPAAAAEEKSAKKPKKAKKPSQASGGRLAKIDRGSEETKGQRQSRLRAECKGKVNAGACEGLTR